MIKSNILLPGTLDEEDQLLLQKMRELCKNNQDIFEKFYAENSDMYYDLSDKLMRLK